MLALRTGLPLFILATTLMFFRLSEYFLEIPSSFFFMAVFILAVSIYFIFYMIYRGFDEQITDPITHTFTRQKVMSIIQDDIKKYDSYSLVLVSIENLGDINARYGIQAGDKALKLVAKEAGKFFISKDFQKFPIGHFKGGDFLIGLKGNYNTIRPFLEMMCLKFDDFVMNDIEIKVRGAIVDKSLSEDVPSLIERLFELKESDMEEGEHVNVLSKDDLTILELEENIRYAIAEKNFSSMFQRIACEEELAQVSFKLQGKDDKIIHQKTFMPIINRLGYEREFDEIILQKVIEHCKKIEKVSFAFNIAPSVIRNTRFMHRFKQIVEFEGIEYSRLIIILSEKEVYANMKRYNAVLQDYRNLGVRFILDNVGSLNSSVEYIKRLEVDIIRFDKPFAKHIDSPVYTSLLYGYLRLCKETKMKSWVKMVDNEETKTFFETIGVDYIQGNVVSKIINFDKLKEERDQE